MFVGGSCLKLCLSKLDSFRDCYKWPGFNWPTLSLNFRRIYFAESVKFSQAPAARDGWGKFFLLFSFSYTYLLSCILFLFAVRYFVNKAPLLRAICKFGYIVCYLALFFLPESIGVTAFVAVDIFLGFLNHQFLLSSAFGKRLRFHRFL